MRGTFSTGESRGTIPEAEGPVGLTPEMAREAGRAMMTRREKLDAPDGRDEWQEHLPAMEIDLVKRRIPCPVCGETAARTHRGQRTLAEIVNGRGVRLTIRYSKHYCRRCRKYRSVPTGRWARASARYGRTVEAALLEIHRTEKNLNASCAELRKRYGIVVPPTTLHEWLMAEMESKTQLSQKETPND